MGERTADESPMLVGTATIGVQESRSRPSGWRMACAAAMLAGTVGGCARYDASSNVPDGLVMQ